MSDQPLGGQPRGRTLATIVFNPTAGKQIEHTFQDDLLKMLAFFDEYLIFRKYSNTC